MRQWNHAFCPIKLNNCAFVLRHRPGHGIGDVPSSLDPIRLNRRLFAFAPRHVSRMLHHSIESFNSACKSRSSLSDCYLNPRIFIGMCIYSLRLGKVIDLPSVMHTPGLYHSL